MVEIYTDGACSQNGTWEGGFGVVEFRDGLLKHVYNDKKNKTTNNAMELIAIIYALNRVTTLYKNEKVIIYSDSAYCVNICNDWIYKWAANNWCKANGKQIENMELIKIIYNYLNKDFFNCQIVKCSGHANIVGNELADALATNNLNKFNKIIEENDVQVDF